MVTVHVINGLSANIFGLIAVQIKHTNQNFIPRTMYRLSVCRKYKRQSGKQRCLQIPHESHKEPCKWMNHFITKHTGLMWNMHAGSMSHDARHCLKSPSELFSIWVAMMHYANEPSTDIQDCVTIVAIRCHAMLLLIETSKVCLAKHSTSKTK